MNFQAVDIYADDHGLGFKTDAMRFSAKHMIAQYYFWKVGRLIGKMKKRLRVGGLWQVSGAKEEMRDAMEAFRKLVTSASVEQKKNGFHDKTHPTLSLYVLQSLQDLIHVHKKLLEQAYDPTSVPEMIPLSDEWASVVEGENMEESTKPLQSRLQKKVKEYAIRKEEGCKENRLRLLVTRLMLEDLVQREKLSYLFRNTKTESDDDSKTALALLTLICVAGAVAMVCCLCKKKGAPAEVETSGQRLNQQREEEEYRWMKQRGRLLPEGL